MATKTAERNGTSDLGELLTDSPDIRSIQIPQLLMREAIITCVGISPLIMHNWSEKALKILEDTQTGKAKEQRAPKVPEEEWRDAAYVIPGHEDDPDWKPGKYYFPASAFKHAFLYGVGQTDDTKKMPKTKATGWVFFNSDPVIQFEAVSLRKDIGRAPVQMVYRPQFEGWSVDLNVSYNERSITLEQVVALLDIGGFMGGIGEWRPSSPKNKTGSFGRFRVKEVKSL